MRATAPVVRVRGAALPARVRRGLDRRKRGVLFEVAVVGDRVGRRAIVHCERVARAAGSKCGVAPVLARLDRQAAQHCGDTRGHGALVNVRRDARKVGVARVARLLGIARAPLKRRRRRR